ncbi:hypothetical protein F4801DRAFT_575680 [Xylaria longipes]|nr:hypothetical protein F4801DRAFT_575680 [Xylaria longipes]
MSLMGRTSGASTPAPFSKDRLRDALDGIDPSSALRGAGSADNLEGASGPFDQGSSETIVDTTVQQNAWELDPQSFAITAQSQWDGMLKEFLTVISRTLGVSNRIVRAELHKLSIWGKGAVFQAHADSEKIPHMFGTLVISLPSHHRGGDVIVRYLDEEAVFSTYEHAMAGVYCLKSRDQACLEELLHACHYLGFDIFLAILEREDVHEKNYEDEFYRIRYDDEIDPHTLGECVNSTLTAKHVHNLSGNEIRTSIAMKKDSIMHSDLFVIGSQTADTYKALVIVPPKVMVSFLTSPRSARFSYSSDLKPQKILDYCIDRCQPSNSESALEVLLQLLQKMEESGQLEWTKNIVLTEKLYKLTMTCHGSELIDWITRYVLPLPLTVLSWSRRQFETFAISFERLNIGFSSVVQPRKLLKDQYQVILAFRADTDPKDELLELIRDTPTKTFSDGNWGSSHSYEDGLALYNLALCAHDGLEVMKSTIIPKLVGTCGEKTEFMLGFIHGWHQGMQREEITLTDSQPIYESLVRVTLQSMSISLLTVEDEEAHDIKRTRQDLNSGLPTTPMTSYKILYRFLASLFQPCLEEQRDIFIKKIAAEAPFINATNFETLWIPVLQDLLNNNEELKISLSDQSWQQFYQTLRESFLLSYVGKALPKPDLIRNPVSCSCNECRDLNQFLLDPIQRVRSFDRSTPSQKTHFLQMFPYNRNDCTNSGYPNYIIHKVEDPRTERERNSRARRKLKAAEHLWGFDPGKLRTVLAGKYQVIMTMNFLEHPEYIAITSPLASSSMQRREPLAPVSANPTAATASPEGGKILRVDNTLSSAPAPTGSNISTYGPSIAYITPSQPVSMSAVTMRTQTLASPQTTTSGIERAGLSTMPSTAPQLEAMRNRVSSAPYTLTWQEIGNLSTSFPSTAATRSVSNLS